MKYTRKLLGIFTLWLILASFASADGFVIVGHIEGIEDNTWVRLYDIDGQMFIDSALSKNGDFLLKGRVENPTTCWLRCENEYAVVRVENTAMKFNSPMKNMYLNSSIEGGREQDLQNELKALQRPSDIIYFGAYDSLVNAKYTNDAEQQLIITRLNDSQSISQSIYVDFGIKHSDSYLGLDIIYSNRKSIAKDTLEIIYENLAPKLKESDKAKALKVFLYEQLVKKGTPFLDFNVKTINGDDFSLSSLKGSYIYLSFWSSGCGPCRMENKLFSRSINDLPKDLSLVSFSVDRNAKSWEMATKADSIVWHNVSDLEGESGKIKTQYQVQAIPTSFLIDREGVVIEQFIGFDTEIISRLRLAIDENEKKH